MNKALLCTLGPASMSASVIAQLERLGVSLFRINLSHTSLADLTDVITTIQSHTSVPICLDTEGAQVRTGRMTRGGAVLTEHAMVKAVAAPVDGNRRRFALYPTDTIGHLAIGDLISIDFNAVLVQVVEKQKDAVVLQVLNGGRIGSNKAVTVHRPLELPPLTEKDRDALRIGAKLGIEHIALSFANRASDVDEIRRVFGKPAFVISKIECINGVEQLEAIAAKSDALLIDRGDLSREFPIEGIPAAQKQIIRRSKVIGRPVYVATNLLESMVTEPVPTRAEVNDIYNTLADGADGLVLAAECAIGNFPVRCADMIVRMVQEFEAGDRTADARDRQDQPRQLIAPHGGTLIHREATDSDRSDVDTLPSLTVRDTDLIDCEQIALGTYSPLTGFMDQLDLRCVLERHRLANTVAWPMPVLLQTTADQTKDLATGVRVVLRDEAQVARALIDITEIYSIDLASVARQWFGTDSTDHPGVARFMAAGDMAVAGPITLLERPDGALFHYRYTPRQIRQVFAHKGWRHVVGFHTRNVAHRAHEHIQLAALARTHADGIFVNPVIGPKKPGDFRSEPILRGYELLISEGVYPAGKVMLGGFNTYSRYAGPREAVFTAICRQNMGCSHFIMGRDHTGVGAYYEPDANRRLFESIDGIGIAPVFFDAIAYNPEIKGYETAKADSHYQTVAGTELRQALQNGKPLPDWLIRPALQDMLRAELAAGRDIFCS